MRRRNESVMISLARRESVPRFLIAWLVSDSSVPQPWMIAPISSEKSSMFFRRSRFSFEFRDTENNFRTFCNEATIVDRIAGDWLAIREKVSRVCLTFYNAVITPRFCTRLGCHFDWAVLGRKKENVRHVAT